MPILKNSQGQEFEVSDSAAIEMAASDPSLTIVGNVRASGERPVSLPAGQVQTLSGVTAASAEEQGAHLHKRRLEEKTSTAGALARGAARTVSFGATDLAFDADTLEADRLLHPVASGAGEIAGAFAPFGWGALASKAGSAVTGLTGGSRIAGAIAEGGVYGAASGVAELAASREPLTLERAGSVLSSNMLFGGAIGGAAGVAGKVLESGLAKARGAIDSVAERSANLAGKSRSELVALEKAEIESIRTATVPRKQELADDLQVFRREVKEQKHALTTMGVDLPAAEGKYAAKEISAVARDANRKLDALTKNPIGLASRPERALEALQIQENAFVQTLSREPELRAIYAADSTGARSAALDSIAPALEKNRALQARITELSAPPSSARLSEIAAAKEAGPAKSGLLDKIIGGSAYGVAAGAVSAVPVVGHFAAPYVGAIVSDGLGKALGGLAKRAQSAADTFVSVAGKTAQPVIASKVLAAVRYGDEAPKARTLAESFHARSAEIRSQVVPSPETGRLELRPEARARVADRIKAVGAVNPHLADAIETTAARRIEYLANALPKRPDLGSGIPLGPSKWQPSDMEMRSFARAVAAVEDPSAVFERASAGTITPEDADVLRSVYPEMLADFTIQVSSKLPELRTSLPYARRLSLSILTGVPVDPAMDPRILPGLQIPFAAEPGTNGGTQAPQFAKLTPAEPTQAQKRAQ